MTCSRAPQQAISANADAKMIIRKKLVGARQYLAAVSFSFLSSPVTWRLHLPVVRMKEFVNAGPDP
jgi:hypothetical protein